MEKITGNRKSGQARLQRLPSPQSLRASGAGGWRSHCGQASPKASPACNAVRPPAAMQQLRAGSTAGRHCGGQATIEYAIVAGVLVAVVAIMYLLRTTFVNYGERILEMIASDYP